MLLTILRNLAFNSLNELIKMSGSLFCSVYWIVTSIPEEMVLTEVYILDMN